MTNLEIGHWLMYVGLKILPYSFAFYFPLRWLEYSWKSGYTRLVKGIWYFALGMTYLAGRAGIDLLVMYICFIEAWDLLFQQIETNQQQKTTFKH